MSNPFATDRNACRSFLEGVTGRKLPTAPLTEQAKPKPHAEWIRSVTAAGGFMPSGVSLRESSSSRAPLREAGAFSVDTTNGILRGVKIIGIVSRNRRDYPIEVLRSSLSLYEGVKVNFDHIPPNTSRSYRDRFGVMKSPRLYEDGIYGDHHLNPKHPFAESFLWDAAHNANSLGYSHDSQGKVTTRGGRTIVESLHSVRSVDVVCDPATTGGLFESLSASVAACAVATPSGLVTLRECWLLNGNDWFGK